MIDHNPGLVGNIKTLGCAAAMLLFGGTFSSAWATPILPGAFYGDTFTTDDGTGPGSLNTVGPEINTTGNSATTYVGTHADRFNFTTGAGNNTIDPGASTGAIQTWKALNGSGTAALPLSNDVFVASVDVIAPATIPYDDSQSLIGLTLSSDATNQHESQPWIGIGIGEKRNSTGTGSTTVLRVIDRTTNTLDMHSFTLPTNFNINNGGADDWNNLKIEVNLTTGTLRAYVNSTLVATHQIVGSLSQLDNIGLAWEWHVDSTDSGDAVRAYFDNFSVAAPEPGSLSLTLLGGLVLLTRRRKAA